MILPATRFVDTIMHSTVSKGRSIAAFWFGAEQKNDIGGRRQPGCKKYQRSTGSQHVSELALHNLQLIWQTGKTTADKYLQKGKSKPHVWVNDFIQEMDKAYAAADVVISRSGAMSVAELCIAKKAVVFVPFPFAAEDHQTANAKHLVDRNAALMVKDEEAQSKLFSTITNLIFDNEKIKSLEHNIAALAITDAAESIAMKIFNSL